VRRPEVGGAAKPVPLASAAVRSSSPQPTATSAPTPSPVVAEKPAARPAPKLDLVVNQTADRAATPSASPHGHEPADKSQQPGGDAATEYGSGDLGQPVLTQLTDHQVWVRLVPRLKLQGMSRNILMQTVMVSRRESKLQLKIDPQYIDLVNDNHRQRIQDALSAHFSATVKVAIEAGALAEETPMAYQQRCRDERLQQARRALEEDAVVQEIMQRFDAALDLQSIEPLGDS